MMPANKLTWPHLLLLLTALTAAAAAAQPPSTDLLRPFTAYYSVFRDGKQQGESRIQLERAADNSWLYRVNVEGTAGMARLAGFEADDVTTFHITNGQLRMTHLQSRSRALFKSREVTATLDWQKGMANWNGDIKDDRRAPTRLSGRPVSSTLLNLMLALDAKTAGDGQVVKFQMLDRGSAKMVEYRAEPETEISVPAGRFQTRPLRRDRRDKNRVITAWYSNELPPTPVRLLQTDDGREKFELRLLRIER